MKKTYILLLTLLLLLDGCVGGRKVSTNSSGAINIIRPSSPAQQERGISPGIPHNPQPNSVKVESLPPVIPKKAVRSHPKSAEVMESAEPNEVLPTAKASDAITPFSPSVSDASKIKVNVIPITNSPPKEVTNNTEEQENTEEKNMKVQWIELGMFYLLVGLALVMVWVIYDIYREYQKAKIEKKIKKNLTTPALRQKKKPARKKRKPRKKSS
jgi:hypothetical protein